MRLLTIMALTCLCAPALAAGGSVQSKESDPAEDLVRQMAEQVRRFEDIVGEYRQDMSRVVELKYQEKRDYIEESFKGRVKELEAEERKRRLDAIARFEEFLRRYPQHPLYTPDALFRLAELYFGRANDEYLRALESYDTRIEAFTSGKTKEQPAEPLQDYGKTIELFQTLIADFPRYRLIDGAYYLLGYTLTEMGEDERGRDAFQTLVRRAPQSQFTPEAWMRIGEYHFDFNELAPAIKAYTQVLAFTESPYYDRALYKLAWTYYRNDEFDAAIKRFVQLVEFADSQGVDGKEGTAGDLREEAIQYIAVSLSEEDWDGDGLPDGEVLLDRAFRYLSGDRPFEVEVLRRLGDIFFDNTRYDDAIAIYRYLLQRFPYHRDNPAVHMRVVESLERQQRLDEAFAERDKVTASYASGSEWYARNENDRDAIKAALELTEQSLIAAAVYYHDRAQQLKDKARVMEDEAAQAESQRFYGAAARNYEAYLSKYPHSKNAYELGFFYAECLFYSGKLNDAAVQYGKVRDESELGQYRHEAAKTAILALEMYLDEQVETGAVKAKASANWDPSGAPSEEYAKDAEGKNIITPEEFEELTARLIGERDAYVIAGLNDPDVPALQGRIAFKAAELYYRYKQFPETRTRMAAILERYPKDEVATYAAAYLIDTYRVEGDWTKMEEWGKRIADLGIEDPELYKEIEVLRLGALFKQAEQDFTDGKYDEAAAKYVQIVTEKPKFEYAEHAINNAAVAYEKLRKFESAMKLYERIYTEYPNSQFAENALYRTAINSEKFFNFEKAMSLYLLLTDKFPDSDKRADALYTAALLQENNQQYRDAAKNYERYVKLFPERDDAPETFYQAALVYKKMGKERDMVRVFNRFIKKYGGDPKQNYRVMKALDTMAELDLKNKRKRDSLKMRERIVKEFDKRGLEAASPEAQFAAKAKFLLVEQDFAKFKKVKFAGSLAKQGKLLQNLINKTVPDLKGKFISVFDYKNIEWSLCAYFRQGQIGLMFADKLYNAPVPKAFAGDIDAEDMYRMQLEDVALPIEEQGVADLEKTIEVGRQNKVMSKCTKETLEVLNRYKPQEYPLFKEEKRALKFEVLSPLPAQGFTPPPAAIEIPVEAPAPVEEMPVGEAPVEGAPPPEQAPVTDAASADTAPADAAPADAAPVLDEEDK